MYVIEKNVPVPENRAKYPFKEMKAGDSFLAKEDQRGSIHASAREAKVIVTISKKSQPPGMIRVWRVE